jgi:predicted nuclease of predicted toxin-antitoxin system
MNGFYFDENVSRDIARGLLKKGVPVTMAADVGMRMKDNDTEHLPYATEHKLVLVTFDHPFASRAQQQSDWLMFRLSGSEIE